MPFEDKTIVCSDCGEEFVHSAEDQSRYSERGFTNDPKRCRGCREKRKAQSHGGGGGGGNRGPRDRGPQRPRPGGGGGGGTRRPPPRDSGGRQDRESFDAICADCGAATTLPFKPRGDRPVYCRDCYRSRK